MLLDTLELISQNPQHGFISLATVIMALVTAISFHEFSHALTATILGDPTPRVQHRLSVNPARHLDPLGTAMILLAGFGWGKPVICDPSYMKPTARTGMALTSLAGPLSNVIFAFLLSLPLKWDIIDVRIIGLVPFQGEQNEITGYVLSTFIFLNLVLAAFNLIPIAPLDGFKVVLGILPRKAAIQYSRLEPIGPGILLLMILLSYMMPSMSILYRIISPILHTLVTLVLPGYV